MKHSMGERLNIRFNRKIKLEFHGARLTSDGACLPTGSLMRPWDYLSRSLLLCVINGPGAIFSMI